MRAFVIVSILVSATVAASAHWTQDSPYTLSVNVPYVSVDVSVLDAAGQPMASLTSEDFSVFEDGQPQRIVHFNPVAAPYSSLLLFDRSASTKSEQAFMQQAVRAFLNGLRPQDRVAVAGFDESFKVLASWESSPERVASALADLSVAEAAGATNLYDALNRSVQREFRGTNGRRAVIALTDGRDSSHYKRTVKSEQVPRAAADSDFQKSLQILRESRVPLYFIAVNTDRNLGPSPGGDYLNLQRVFGAKGLAIAFLQETRERLERIASITGGAVFFPQSIEQVASVYGRVRGDLTSSYTLGYVSSNGASSGKPRSIVVRVSKAGAKVRQSREGYAAP